MCGPGRCACGPRKGQKQRVAAQGCAEGLPALPLWAPPSPGPHASELWATPVTSAGLGSPPCVSGRPAGRGIVPALASLSPRLRACVAHAPSCLRRAGGAPRKCAWCSGLPTAVGVHGLMGGWGTRDCRQARERGHLRAPRTAACGRAGERGEAGAGSSGKGAQRWARGPGRARPPGSQEPWSLGHRPGGCRCLASLGWSAGGVGGTGANRRTVGRAPSSTLRSWWGAWAPAEGSVWK